MHTANPLVSAVLWCSIQQAPWVLALPHCGMHVTNLLGLSSAWGKVLIHPFPLSPNQISVQWNVQDVGPFFFLHSFFFHSFLFMSLYFSPFPIHFNQFIFKTFPFPPMTLVGSCWLQSERGYSSMVISPPLSCMPPPIPTFLSHPRWRIESQLLSMPLLTRPSSDKT